MGRIAKNSAPEAWERAKRMAYWDQGKITYPQWIASVKKDDQRAIQQGVSYMRAADFINLVGRKMFEKHWPEWRKLQPSSNSSKATILDAAWSLYVAGDVSFPVNAQVTKFHSKKIATLRAVICSDGTDSIYQIAKKLDRNYRRVYDDIQDFAQAGIVKILEERRAGRITKIAKVPGLHSFGRT